MKAIYAFLSAALAIFTAVPAAAYTITVEVDNPDAVVINLNGSPVAYADGVASIEFTDNTYFSVDAVDGYVLSGVQYKAAGTDYWVNDTPQSATSHYISCYGEYYDGYAYKVTTGKLDDLRTASFTLLVDRPEAVRVRASWTYATIQPTSTETVVRYVPGKETPLQLESTSSKNFYKVTVGGTEISPSYTGYYTLSSLKDGDVVEVESDFPYIDCALTFNLSETVPADFIKSVSVNYNDIENWQNASVKVGSEVSIYYNAYDYKISRFDVNGQSIAPYGYYSSPYTFVINGDTTVDIDAAPYGQVEMTVDVAKAEYVVLYTGYDYTDPSAVIALNDGVTTFSVPETTGSVRLRSTGVAILTSVTLDGRELSKGYDGAYEISVVDGGAIVVEAEPIVRDDVFAFYFDSPAKANDNSKELYGYDFRTGLGKPVSLQEGYNVINFGDVDGEYSFAVYNGKTDRVFFYINGVTPEFASEYVTLQFTPANGDVVKCFVGEEPESYLLSFNMEAGMEAPEVVVDKVNKLASLNELSVMQGTHVSITPAAGDSYRSVYAGDDAVEPNDEGRYEFTVDKDTPVTISKSSESGIDSIIAGEVAGERVVYNLQGVRVSGSKLPAGIYIVNGKKTIIR